MLVGVGAAACAPMCSLLFMSTKHPYSSIGDARMCGALLTTSAGYDVARLERVFTNGDAEHAKALLDDKQWQRVIDLVDAAPDLYDALVAALPALSGEVRKKADAAIRRVENDSPVVAAPTIEAVQTYALELRSAQDEGFRAIGEQIGSIMKSRGISELKMAEVYSFDFCGVDDSTIFISNEVSRVRLNDNGHAVLAVDGQDGGFDFQQVLPADLILIVETIAKSLDAESVRWDDDNPAPESTKCGGNHWFHGTIISDSDPVSFSFCLMVTLVGGQRTTADEITFPDGGAPSDAQKFAIRHSFQRQFGL